MKKARHSFDAGDVIFREGEPSDTAFEIVSGNVEISKRSDGGNFRLAVLSPGEMFGEMGVLDQGIRSATATATGPVTVNVISRKDFLAGVQERPEIALGIMSKMAERLRDADEQLALGALKTMTKAPLNSGLALPVRPHKGGETAPAPARKKGFWNELFTFKDLPKIERIEVQVAPLAGDEGNKHAKAIVRALAKRKGLRARMLKKSLPINPDDAPDAQQKSREAAARMALASTDSDLLIWGEVMATGLTLHLKFIAFATWKDAPPGSFTAGTILPLPTDIPPAFADFLHAGALAATVPKSEGVAATLKRDRPLALDSARDVFDGLSKDLTNREKAWLRACYANALTTVAFQRGDIGLFEGARDAYRESLVILTEDEAPYEWAIFQKHLGAVLQAIAERTHNKDILGEAADTYRTALKGLSQTDHPFEWAAVQNRLGEALYRLDFESGDTEMLKYAIGAFQSSLQVYTRTKTPMRWAEAMDNLAQVTQVLGEQLKNSEALEKATQACRAALEVRTKAEVPLLWAATQNNLGSALFLLGKMTKGVGHLQGAAEAFDLAGGVYRARGMEKMVAVTDKNLEHVNQLLAHLQPKDLPPMDWESDE
ncbi:MAG: Crp/Fnr family transcriptional regulator [Proteobacteria bacterium]|nr:Crp/Fnr family transcriptional regulator [Pseudomonadota bacterium]